LSGHPRQGLQTLSAKNAKIICSDIDGLSFLVKASGSGMIEKNEKTPKKTGVMTYGVKHQVNMFGLLWFSHAHTHGADYICSRNFDHL